MNASFDAKLMGFTVNIDAQNYVSDASFKKSGGNNVYYQQYCCRPPRGNINTYDYTWPLWYYTAVYQVYILVYLPGIVNVLCTVRRRDVGARVHDGVVYIRTSFSPAAYTVAVQYPGSVHSSSQHPKI